MVTITAQVSGNQIAFGLAGDPEEAAQMLTEFADQMTESDRDRLLGWMSDYAGSMSDKARLVALGELLIEAAK